MRLIIQQLTAHEGLRESWIRPIATKKLNYLNGVNIVGDDNKLSFLLLNQGGDGVGSVAESEGTLGWGIFLAGGTSFSASLETSLPVLLGLWTVLVQKTEQLGG